MEPRFQRRKADRPAEIVAAALSAFAENGYAATRVDDVAQRAGVSKGLLYLYFDTKEALFKAVIKSFVVPHLETLKAGFDASGDGAEAFLRGPFLRLVKSLPESPARVLVRLMVAEGPRFPDLTAFYHGQVIRPGLSLLRSIIQRGVDAGEFRKTALLDYPQLLVTPVVFSMLWGLIFDRHEKLDKGRLIEAHVELVIRDLKAEEPQ